MRRLMSNDPPTPVPMPIAVAVLVLIGPLGDEALDVGTVGLVGDDTCVFVLMEDSIIGGVALDRLDWATVTVDEVKKPSRVETSEELDTSVEIDCSVEVDGTMISEVEAGRSDGEKADDATGVISTTPVLKGELDRARVVISAALIVMGVLGGLRDCEGELAIKN